MILFFIFVTIIMLITIPELGILFLIMPLMMIGYAYIDQCIFRYRNGYYEYMGIEPPFWCKWFKK